MEVLDELKIPYKGNYSEDGSYVIELTDEQFAKSYSILDKECAYDVDTSKINTYDSWLCYTYGDYEIVLMADLTDNTYRLVVNDFS